eukprot:CAMPEP_0194444026 /NCGR_PEP_ID=MMETSP0176-20130528/127034_1 /TAXON_ID=216777 /ORGANISM="Proboscia alata, Strain PI-D3" /LENGTH=871 /DNA_ID=CAMNT_0039270345 /DNA_START=150 /DNA_END=2762 /DNA_ORIENTATION=-
MVIHPEEQARSKHELLGPWPLDDDDLGDAYSDVSDDDEETEATQRHMLSTYREIIAALEKENSGGVILGSKISSIYTFDDGPKAVRGSDGLVQDVFGRKLVIVGFADRNLRLVKDSIGHTPPEKSFLTHCTFGVHRAESEKHTKILNAQRIHNSHNSRKDGVIAAEKSRRGSVGRKKPHSDATMVIHPEEQARSKHELLGPWPLDDDDPGDAYSDISDDDEETEATQRHMLSTYREIIAALEKENSGGVILGSKISSIYTFDDGPKAVRGSHGLVQEAFGRKLVIVGFADRNLRLVKDSIGHTPPKKSFLTHCTFGVHRAESEKHTKILNAQRIHNSHNFATLMGYLFDHDVVAVIKLDNTPGMNGDLRRVGFLVPQWHLLEGDGFLVDDGIGVGKRGSYAGRCFYGKLEGFKEMIKDLAIQKEKSVPSSEEVMHDSSSSSSKTELTTNVTITDSNKTTETDVTMTEHRKGKTTQIVQNNKSELRSHEVENSQGKTDKEASVESADTTSLSSKNTSMSASKVAVPPMADYIGVGKRGSYAGRCFYGKLEGFKEMIKDHKIQNEKNVPSSEEVIQDSPSSSSKSELSTNATTTDNNKTSETDVTMMEHKEDETTQIAQNNKSDLKSQDLESSPENIDNEGSAESADTTSLSSKSTSISASKVAVPPMAATAYPGVQGSSMKSSVVVPPMAASVNPGMKALNAKGSVVVLPMAASAYPGMNASNIKSSVVVPSMAASVYPKMNSPNVKSSLMIPSMAASVYPGMKASNMKSSVMVPPMAASAYPGMNASNVKSSVVVPPMATSAFPGMQASNVKRSGVVHSMPAPALAETRSTMKTSNVKAPMIMPPPMKSTGSRFAMNSIPEQSTPVVAKQM